MAYGKRKSNPTYKRKRNYRKKATTKRSYIAKVAKSVLFKTAETKSVSHGGENLNLYHNTYALVNSSLTLTSQGVGDDNTSTSVGSRIGDSIQAKKLWIRMMLFNKQDRPNVHYRVLLVRRNTTQNGNTLAVPTSFFKLDHFPSNNNNFMADPSDEQVSVLIDRRYSIQNQQSRNSDLLGNGYEVSKLINLNYKIPQRHQKIIYSDAGTVPKNYVYQLWVMSYDSYGTLQTDNISSCAYTARFYYTDI